MLWRWLKRRKDGSQALAIYSAIVAASRQPAFFAELGIPDDLEGRFEMLVAHGALVSRRLSGGGETAKALSQQVFDLMFTDLDQSLREMGVGDMAVPRRIRKMAEAFFGRAKAYSVALADDAPADALNAVLARNAYGADAAVSSEDNISAMADYMRAANRAFAKAPDETLFAAKLPFPDAAAFVPERQAGS